MDRETTDNTAGEKAQASAPEASTEGEDPRPRVTWGADSASESKKEPVPNWIWAAIGITLFLVVAIVLYGIELNATRRDHSNLGPISSLLPLGYHGLHAGKIHCPAQVNRTKKEVQMNSVQLVGRLATEIELREVTGDSKVCSFILAVDRSGDEADFPILPTAQSSGSSSPGGMHSRTPPWLGPGPAYVYLFSGVDPPAKMKSTLKLANGGEPCRVKKRKPKAELSTSRNSLNR